MGSKYLILSGVVMVLAIATTKFTKAPLVRSVPQATIGKQFETVPPVPVQSSQPSQSQDKPLQTGVVDYYGDLPSFDDLVASFQGLKDAEIDQTIAEVENQLKSEGLVDLANEKKLGEAGYQRLAALIQKSDALYHIKITRKVDEVEKSLAQTK
jgi:hypothetical protein